MYKNINKQIILAIAKQARIYNLNDYNINNIINLIDRVLLLFPEESECQLEELISILEEEISTREDQIQNDSVLDGYKTTTHLT